jgi:hypothetical protein
MTLYDVMSLRNKVKKRNNVLFYAFQWITDLSVKIIFDNFTVKIIKI